MPADKFYYLLRKGTNVRAVGKDDEPVICDEETLQVGIDFFDRMVPLRELPLVGISIDEYYRRFRTASVRAKRQAQQELDAEFAAQRIEEGGR